MHIAVLLTVLAVPSLASAGSFRRIDLPGAGITCGTAIASNGLVAGFASGGSLVGPTPFLLRGQHFTIPALALPAGIILLDGLNRSGAFVGADLFSQSVGAERFTGRGDTVAPAPGFNVLAAITDAGTVVGQIASPTKPAIYNVGVIQTRSGKQTILDDGTGTTNPAGFDATARHVVGTSATKTGITAWRWDAGSFTTLAVPGAVTTLPTAITTGGVVYGSYRTSTSTAVEHGFVLGPQGYQTWDAPQADSTSITDANEAGEITGCYTDKGGITHGYVAVP